MLAFDGDVFGRGGARSLNGHQLARAHAWPLRMGVTGDHFCGMQIANYPHTRLRSDISPAVISLALQESFTGVDIKALVVPDRLVAAETATPVTLMPARQQRRIAPRRSRVHGHRLLRAKAVQIVRAARFGAGAA